MPDLKEQIIALLTEYRERMVCQTESACEACEAVKQEYAKKIADMVKPRKLSIKKVGHVVYTAPYEDIAVVIVESYNRGVLFDDEEKEGDNAYDK